MSSEVLTELHGNEIGLDDDRALIVRSGIIKSQDGSPISFPDGILGSTGSGINVLDYGAVGDGVTADNAAIAAAHAAAVVTGTYVFFPARTYGFSSQFSISTGGNVKWIGDPNGGTIFKRVGAAIGSGSSIAMGGASVTEVYIENIRFNFDKATFSSDACWGLRFNTNVKKARIKGCFFEGAPGAIGNGLYFEGNGSAVDGTFAEGWYVVEDCDFYNNDESGVWATNADRVLIINCRAWNNGDAGFRLDTIDINQIKTNRRSVISNCWAWANGNGYVIGNLNSTNGSGGVLFGTGFADVRQISIDNCYAIENTGYGFAIYNDYIAMSNCHSENNAFANLNMMARDTTIDSSTFIDTTQNNPWNLDVAASTRCTYSNLTIVGSSSGLSGLGIYSRATGCRFIDQTGNGIALTPVESSGSNVAFQDLGEGFTVQGCQFFMSDSTVRGVWAPDGYQGLVVEDCDFWPVGTAVDSDIYNAMVVHSDKYVVRNNRWDGKRSFTKNPTAGSTWLVPIVLDEINITSAGYTLSSNMTNIRIGVPTDMHQRVTWVRVTHKGVGGATPFTGTLPTTITFSGGGGSGASAQPFFDQDGWLLGARMNSNYGSGYTSTPTAVIGGTGGTGCTITPNVGAPLPTGHRMHVWALNPIDLVSSTPTLNLIGTRSRVRIPAGGRLTLTANFNQWYVENRYEDYYGTTYTSLTTLGSQLSAATVSAGGTGYTLGDTLTLTGTGSAQVRVTGVSGGAVTAVALLAQGDIAVAPGNPVATTGGTGSGCTITATWVAVSHVCSDTCSELVAAPSGIIAAATITMPAFPADGMRVEINSTKAITTLTVQGNTGQTLTGAATTLAADSAIAYRYRASTTTWRRCA